MSPKPSVKDILRSAKDKSRSFLGLPPKSREPSPRPSSRQSKLSILATGCAAGQSASTPAFVSPDVLRETPPTSTTDNTTPDSAQTLQRSRSVSSLHDVVAASVETPPTATQQITSTTPLPSITIASGPAATAFTACAAPDTYTTLQPETSKAPPSLWQEALSKLEQLSEHRILLENCVGVDVHGITSSIEENITRIEKERKGKEWKIPFLGNVIVMKDIAMKMLRWVHKFREIGDIASQYDPVHAALPWAAFRFLLKVCVEKADVLDAILIGLEKTACIIARCAIYESIYIQGARTKATDNLQKSTVQLYTVILMFVAKAITKSKEGHLKAAFTIELTSNYFDDVKELEETVEKDAAAAGAHHMTNEFDNLRLILCDLHTTSSRIGPQVDEVLQLLEESMRSEILKWISTIPYTEHHTRISTTRLPGTGEWLFQKGEYKEWLSSSVSRVLLLRGIPGAGKTFIASVAIDSFSSDARLGKLAYFYCSRAEESRRDPETILSALIHQLVRTESDKKMLLKPIVDAYELRKSQGQQNSRLSLLESRALLVKLADVYEQTTICIDALDEVEPSTRKNLLQALKFVIENSKNLVKIFATTRMDVDIVRQFEMFPRIELQPDDNASDIERFIKERIETSIKDGELLDGAIGDDLKAEMCNVLGERSRGMFQLAALQTTYLCGMTTEKEVRNGLRRLPDTLKDAYQQIYERILAQQPEARKRALNAFRWVKFSCEPVRSETLLDAVSVDISCSGEFSHQVFQPNVLLKACQNLIILDESLNVFRFAHLSVDEFFDDKLSPEDSHTEIAQTCLSLICTPMAWECYDSSVTTCKGQYKDRHLLQYSAAFWPWHFARAKDCGILDTIWDTFVSGTSYLQWCEYSSETANNSCGSDEMHWERVEAHAGQTNSILSCVCVFDISRKFVKIFDSCAPPSMVVNTLLSTACHFGDLEIARLLIGKGADVSALSNDRWTPVYCVTSGESEEAVRLLIDKDADSSATYNDGKTPLHCASSRGREKVARLLIDKGADISAVDENGRTPLHCASSEGVARLLIDKGADVSSVGKDGRTPLHCASREEVARLLIDKGADISAVSKDGRTPLHCVLDNWADEVAQLLVDKGADISAVDKDGRTPLHYASSKKVARLLIDKGADVSVVGKDGWTPLHCALDSWEEEVARLLIDKGADISAVGKDGRTPLHCASSRGCEKVARLLIDKGADISAVDENGRTPLHCASSEEVARLLIDKGADVSVIGKDGRTPLHCMLDSWAEEAAQLLINKGADIFAVDEDGRTPHHCASSEEVARLLIDKGADVSAVGKDGRTPLHCVLDSLAEEVAQLLIVKGADHSAVGKDGRMPLHCVLDSWAEEVAQLLIDKGADISAVDEDGRTPLHCASSRGYEKVARFLIDKGADVSATDKDGRIPFILALSGRNEGEARQDGTGAC